MAGRTRAAALHGRADPLLRRVMIACLAPAVFLLAAAVLGYEILLLRLFAIETFHHLAHMAIGVALLGSGASGAALVLAGGRLEGRRVEAFAGLAAATALAMLATPALAHRWIGTLNGAGTGWTAWAAMHALLALPFLTSGAAQAVALQAAGARVGRVYAWSLLGAAAGTVASLALLDAFAPARALALATLPAAAAGAVAAAALRKGARRVRPATVQPWLALAVGSAVLAVAAAARPAWNPRVAAAKALAVAEAGPGARRLAETWGPAGWVVALEAPGFRHAPGLSAAFRGEVPPQVALFVDGEAVGAATVHGGDPAHLEFLHWLPSAAAYAVSPTPPASVLVIGAGDGLEVLGALARGAKRITALEKVRALSEAADASLPPDSRVLQDPRVSLVVADARAYIAGTRGRFDAIALPSAVVDDGIGSVLHGAREDFLNTVEAYEAYLRGLAPGGILAVTRWLHDPPRDNLKVILTAGAALERLDGADAGGRILLVRSTATATLLVKPDGFSSAEIARVREFAAERLFDVDGPALGEAPAPEQDARVISPFQHALDAIDAGPAHAGAFARRYALDIAPATDDRPFFGHGRRTATSNGHDGAGNGTGALTSTLARSAFAATLVLLVALVALARRRDLPATTGGIGRTAAYFAAIGFGFVFVEIAAIQRLSLVLGHPVYATALTLAAILAFSGVGAALTDRLPPAAAATACLAVAATAATIALTLPWTRVVETLPFAGRAAAALLLVAIPAVLMGGPFPLGLRRLTGGGVGIAWAWAANGVAAVVASTLAALLAMEAGGRAVVAVGALCYLLAAAAAAIPRARTH